MKLFIRWMHFIPERKTVVFVSKLFFNNQKVCEFHIVGFKSYLNWCQKCHDVMIKIITLCKEENQIMNLNKTVVVYLFSWSKNLWINTLKKWTLRAKLVSFFYFFIIIQLNQPTPLWGYNSILIFFF